MNEEKGKYGNSNMNFEQRIKKYLGEYEIHREQQRGGHTIFPLPSSVNQPGFDRMELWTYSGAVLVGVIEGEKENAYVVLNEETN